MRRLMAPIVLVLVVGLGSYAIFAQQQPSGQAPRGMGRGMMAGGMGRGMMGGMGCPGCAAVFGGMMQESVTATSDGGVVVVIAGKLVKYDAGLRKINEATVEIDWAALHQKMQQMMQNCPMMQQMMKQQGTPAQGQPTP